MEVSIVSILQSCKSFINTVNAVRVIVSCNCKNELSVKDNKLETSSERREGRKEGEKVAKRIMG